MAKKLITCYVDPDLDGTACAVAYAEFLNSQNIDATAGIIGEMHDEAKYIFNRFQFTKPEQIANDENFQEVVLVDASDTNGLEGDIDVNKVIEIIDHRKINDANLFPNAKVQIEMVGAAATLVAEKFFENKIAISKMSATLLYGAIISNTLNFQATVTTDRDIKMASWLKEVAELGDNFWLELFQAKSDLSGNKLQKRMEGEFANFEIGNKKFAIVQVEIVGVNSLLENRLPEILQQLDNLKIKNNLDFIFQTTIDLENKINIFIANDRQAQNILSAIFEINFENNIATRNGLIMRKQIVPLIKEFLEKLG